MLVWNKANLGLAIVSNELGCMYILLGFWEMSGSIHKVSFLNYLLCFQYFFFFSFVLSVLTFQKCSTASGILSLLVSHSGHGPLTICNLIGLWVLCSRGFLIKLFVVRGPQCSCWEKMIIWNLEYYPSEIPIKLGIAFHLFKTTLKVKELEAYKYYD